MDKFVLPFYISNNGDGSASAHFCKNFEEAEEKDEGQSEGWGESSADKVEIILKNGELFIEETDWNMESKTYGKKVRIKLEKVVEKPTKKKKK
jgi:hypothetical protein